MRSTQRQEKLGTRQGRPHDAKFPKAQTRQSLPSASRATAIAGALMPLASVRRAYVHLFTEGSLCLLQRGVEEIKAHF